MSLNKLLWSFFVCVMIGVLPIVTNAQSALPDISIGIADVYEKDPQTRKRIRTVAEIESLINWHVTNPADRLLFDRVVIFIDVLDDAEFRKALTALNRHIKQNRDIVIVPLLRSRDKKPNARAIADGTYDPQLTKLAGILKSKFYGTATIVNIRPLHEIDGGWYSWQRYYKQFTADKAFANSAHDVIRAWKHVHSIFKNALGNNVLFEFNVNRRPASGKVSTRHLRKYYPGNDFVDRIVVSSYNRCGIDAGKKQRSFAEEFDPVYKALLPFKKPIGIGETSTTSLCAYKGPWFKQLFKDLYTRYPDVVSVDFFLNKAPLNRHIPWHLENKSQAQSFHDGWQDLLKHRKQVHKPRAYFQAVKERWSKYDPDYPWSFRMSVMQHKGVFNDAINPVTGNAFGDKGLITQLYAEQGIVFPLNVGDIGLYGSITIIDSDNPNQWWNNKRAFQVKVKRCVDVSFADWGGACAVLGTEWTDYTVDVPRRLEGTTRGVFGGFQLNIGGKWLK